MNSGWLLFEAGAISKELDDDTRIYPILIDLPLSDLKYPLAQFQAIELTQDGSNNIHSDFKWENMGRKSQLIHKITSLIGVPVERMVYVGDNNMDFEAASRIKIDFIEARLFSDEVEKSIGKESLIDVKGNSEHWYFTSWSEFCKKLVEVEKHKERNRKEEYGF